MLRLKRHFTILFVGFCALVATSNKAFAQLFAENGGGKKNIIIYYTNKPKISAKIFEYNIGVGSPENIGRIRAISPDKTKGWTFRWYCFDLKKNVLKDTLAPVTLNDTNSMVLDNLPYGCYKVKMTKGSLADSSYAWVLINKLRYHLKKTSDGYVQPWECTCSSISLAPVPSETESWPDNLRYVHSDYFNTPNPEKPAYYPFVNTITLSVTSKDGAVFKPGTSSSYTIDEPPSHDATYYVKFTDTLGAVAYDTILYKSIIPKADFTIYSSQDTMGHVDEWNYQKKSSGEAPLRVRVISKCENTKFLKWVLADSIHFPEDSMYYFHTSTDSIDTVSDVVYRFPYKYKLTLIAKKDLCTDTATQTLEVKYSRVGNHGENAFPKFFTPGGSNPYFTMKGDSLQSIKNLHLYITDSHGKKVYEYNGKVAQGWHGWDGQTLWGAQAPTGRYYYYFKAEGYGKIVEKPDTPPNEEKDREVVENKGFFYLFRNPN